MKYMVSVVLALAVTIRSSHLGLFAAVIAAGFVLGTLGHIIRSRALILTGILVIAVASSFYVFGLEPGAG